MTTPAKEISIRNPIQRAAWCRLMLPAACLCLLGPGAQADAPPPASGNKALTVYAGRMTNEHWYQSLTPGADFVDSRLATVAWSQTFLRPAARSWSLEWEANATKHWGLQDHWEYNLALSGRWHRFPWNDTINTSIAYGLGPSYATEIPPHEVARGGNSQKWLAFWYLELALSPPGSGWSGILRLHHRSDAFGLLGDTGSADALTLGIHHAF